MANLDGLGIGVGHRGVVKANACRLCDFPAREVALLDRHDARELARGLQLTQ